MTSSVPKQDPKTQNVKRVGNLIWQYKAYANFQGKPPFQATKQHNS